MLSHIWPLLVLMLPAPASLVESSSYRGTRTTEDGEETTAGGTKRCPGRPEQIYAGKYFKKGPRDPRTGHRSAHCLACGQSVVSKEVDMERHLLNCSRCDCRVRADIQNQQRRRVIDDYGGAESDEENVGCKRRAREAPITAFLARKPTAKEQTAVEDWIVRFVATAGVPFTVVDNPAFQRLIEMRPGILAPNRCKLGTSILDREATRCREKVLGVLQQQANLTVCTDGWTDCSKKCIQGTVVVTPERLVYPLGFVDTSNVRHTAKEMLDQLLTLLVNIDPSKVVAICTDNAGNMKLLRSLLTAEDAYKHVISIRCHMHAFGLLLVSLLRHPWANKIVYRAQSIVSFFRESTYLYNKLKTFPNAPTNKSLQSSNTTRMTSVEMMLASVSSYSNALQLFAAAGATDPDLDIPVRNSDPQRISRASTVKDTIQDPEFYRDLRKLLLVLTPISKVIMAVQSCESTLADVTRYWIYLTRELRRILQELPSGFQRHVARQYNKRYKELDSPLCRLALLLHPCYRKAAAPTCQQVEELFDVAHNLLRKYGHGSPRLLANRLLRYIKERPPYHLPCGGKDFGREAAKAWWRATGHPDNCPLVAVALLLLDVIPTAASTERVFSTMGWTKSKTRNRMSPDTLAKLTTIKMMADLQLKPQTSNKQADKAVSEVADGNTGEGVSVADMFLPMPDEDLDEAEVGLTINSLTAMDDEDNEEDWEAELQAAQGLSFVQLLMDDWWPVNKQHPTMTLEGARVNEAQGRCDETLQSTTPAVKDTVDEAHADLRAEFA